MNEEALNDAYQYFTSTGYDGSIQDFSNLLKSNEEAFNDSFDYFKNTGYNGDKSKFSTLLGVDFDMQEEEKGATPQKDATVDVEDTASDSGDGSSDLAGSLVDNKEQVEQAQNILEILKDTEITEEENASSELMASEILAESQVDVEETPTEEQPVFQEGSFFPREDLLESTQDQTTDVVKGRVESEEKTRRNTKQAQIAPAKASLSNQSKCFISYIGHYFFIVFVIHSTAAYIHNA